MPESSVQPATQGIVQQATTGTTTPEFSYQFTDGRVIKAESQEELTKQVGARYEELFPHFNTLKTENANYRTENANYRNSIAQLAGNQPTTQANGFSQEVYLEKWTKNPLEAQQYVNSFDPQLNAAVNQLEQIQWQQQASAFREANPDFQMTTDNINHLSKVCDEMFPGSKVVTSKQMEAAHLYCQKQKLYGATNVTQTTNVNPPPLPPNGTSQVSDGAPDITKMDQKALRAYIESLEQQKQQA